MLQKVFPRWYFILLLLPYIAYGLAVWLAYELNDGYAFGGSGDFESDGFFAWFVPITAGVVAYLALHSSLIYFYNKRNT